jgi:hypothetical protein
MLAALVIALAAFTLSAHSPPDRSGSRLSDERHHVRNLRVGDIVAPYLHHRPTLLDAPLARSTGLLLDLDRREEIATAGIANAVAFGAEARLK